MAKNRGKQPYDGSRIYLVLSATRWGTLCKSVLTSKSLGAKKKDAGEHTKKLHTQTSNSKKKVERSKEFQRPWKPKATKQQATIVEVKIEEVKKEESQKEGAGHT